MYTVRQVGIEATDELIHLWLCVSDANERAQRFYQKLGFKLLSPGPTLEVGTDHLSSTILALNIGTR